jgi:hypothetical protein
MTPPTEAQLAAWEALCAAATPGPWEHRIDTSWAAGPDRLIDSADMVIIRNERCDKHFKQGRGDEANFDFIAASREAMPALIAEVRRFRVLLDARKEGE